MHWGGMRACTESRKKRTPSDHKWAKSVYYCDFKYYHIHTIVPQFTISITIGGELPHPSPIYKI